MHMKQVEAMIKATECTYAAELLETEQQFWFVLNERARTTFRICRDLALYCGPQAPEPLNFYLAGESLAQRHGMIRSDGKPQGEFGARELRKLLQFDMIKVVTPGRPRASNTPGLPTLYKWLLH
jgi:hypothetical protein